MAPLKRQTNIAFLELCLIGLFFVFAFVYICYLLYSRLQPVWLSWAGKLKTACGCVIHLSYLDHPYIIGLLGAAGLVTAAFIIYAGANAVKLKLATQRLVRTGLSKQKHILSPKLTGEAERLGMEGAVIEIDDPGISVFCFGFLRPKIFISAGLADGLTREELHSVLLHEQHHIAMREPLRLFVVKTLAKILFFIPGFDSLARRYFVLLELAADEWTINTFHDKTPLAKAMYKMLQWGVSGRRGSALAVSSFTHVTEERINKMLDADYAFRVRVLTRGFFYKFVGLLCFAAIFSFFIHTSQKAIAANGSAVCPSGYGQMPVNTTPFDGNMTCGQSCSHLTLPEPVCQMTSIETGPSCAQ